MNNLAREIDALWNNSDVGDRTNLKPSVLEERMALIQKVLDALDGGEIRVAEKKDGKWHVHQWIKKAILLSFRYSDNKVINPTSDLRFYDKIPLKTMCYNREAFESGGFRMVPGTVVRYSAYIAKNVVLTPSFINVGAYIDEGTMIDTWVTVGSCAQIGKNCHISEGAGIGGVLEPLQGNPVIIEDNVFIGMKSAVTEGVIVEEGAVISAGVFITSSTRIYDRESDQIIYGKIPSCSVVVPGSLPSSDGKTHTSAAIIVKKVDNKTRASTSINEILRH
ncbi:2,3,4,5-tetrahydropyridine-2,6-dicarboxylate N-succinyltransferase [Rickettsiales endosymbiont of Peranema trichophorum]|uniref:2,3,4,5-tetrahydropyridine-2,6-dicarboxylate N-succinyltransferase n=1 Tax=Rickettsiales endosymbiont of Peranema trichophorum TaxID=2486577 RepID=UPI001023C1C8|nr:2,3,4,5-tetrahydropyridine-2,6-dicarboxylate N-succinyltransferase [Rickettsiales endosymbiont of Peranema trichophorum]RZI47221.1 2,3,4,5-tetrahydropyridine-2,6-dicarboxylate N-succinyltransferase [Rickettsiales endosymbiont of Peranema trichophorum]